MGIAPLTPVAQNTKTCSKWPQLPLYPFFHMVLLSFLHFCGPSISRDASHSSTDGKFFLVIAISPISCRSFFLHPKKQCLILAFSLVVWLLKIAPKLQQRMAKNLFPLDDFFLDGPHTEQEIDEIDKNQSRY